jgi:hypothetical protein
MEDDKDASNVQLEHVSYWFEIKYKNNHFLAGGAGPNGPRMF